MNTTVCKRACLVVGLLILAAYVVRYAQLSGRGRYEPAMIGLNGVKQYRWAPEGFVSEFRWNRSKLFFYYPIHYIDTHYFHTSDRAYSEKYPVNEVPMSEIGKVYRAWGL